MQRRNFPKVLYVNNFLEWGHYYLLEAARVKLYGTCRSQLQHQPLRRTLAILGGIFESAFVYFAV